MKKKLAILGLSLLTISTLASCNHTQDKYYDVVWNNWDGTTLEYDYNVIEGKMAKYNSNTPTRESDKDYKYVFAGWDKEIGVVNSNITYTAQYNTVDYDYSIELDYNDGKTPNGVFKFDEDYIDYKPNFRRIFDLQYNDISDKKHNWQLDDGSIISDEEDIILAIKNGNKKFIAKYYVDVKTAFYLNSDDSSEITMVRELPEIFGTYTFPKIAYLDENYKFQFDLENNENILGFDAYYAYGNQVYRKYHEVDLDGTHHIDDSADISNDYKIDSFDNIKFDGDVILKIFIDVKSCYLEVNNNIDPYNSFVEGYLYNLLTVGGIDVIKGRKMPWGSPVILSVLSSEYELDGYYDENDNLLSNENIYNFIITKDTTIIAKAKNNN